MRGITEVIKDIINAEIHPPMAERLRTSRLVALTPAAGKIRPIAVGECLVRLASAYLMAEVAPAMGAIFPSCQYALSRGASQLAVTLIQAAIEGATGEVALLKLDIANAYNSRSRGDILRILYETERLKPLWRFVDWAYANPSDLLLEGASHNECIKSVNGVRQGDPLAGVLFALSVQHTLEEVQRKAKETNPESTLIAIMDDINIVTTPSSALELYDHIHDLFDDPRLGLRLRPEKCAIMLQQDHVLDSI
ncbi:MAG: hypothetical protein L0177_20810, partial [Chloroflexi bacterium]|nr:hypothetical protein [Chloroflexota bacterium]